MGIGALDNQRDDRYLYSGGEGDECGEGESYISESQRDIAS